MKLSNEFYRSVIDSAPEHIVVIDSEGCIQYVNQGWIDFAIANGCPAESGWQGVNYLDVCDAASAMGEELASEAADGIRKVIRGEHAVFYFEYPCHSPEEKRWFMMRATLLNLDDDGPYFVLSHHNITERKLAEERVLELSRLDGLTGVANRRYFDEFLHEEWLRCTRLNLPISLLLLDVDHFKEFNDHYGHQAGDGCLRQIGNVLKLYGTRPGDLVARYGGEEFAVILGNTSLENAAIVANYLHKAIKDLAIPHAYSNTASIVTASIGVASMQPGSLNEEMALIEAADKALYSAKKNGRNRVFEVTASLSIQDLMEGENT